jgi:hypothetical protein
MLFSATMPSAIVALARTHMRHPMNIRAESGEAQQTVPATAQFIYQVHDLDKPELISRILQGENSGLTIVFTRTKRAAQRLAEDLEERFDLERLAQHARRRSHRGIRSGDDHDLGAGEPWLGAHHPDHFPAVHVVHVEVEQHEVGSFVREVRERLGAASHGDDVPAVLLHQGARRFADVVVVVNYQKTARHIHTLFAPGLASTVRIRST